MADWPDWFKRALSRRFDEMANLLAEQHSNSMIKMKLSTITEELQERLEPEVFLKILEWEESVNHQHTMEKEWLYSEGVRDGMRLMHNSHCSLGDYHTKI